MDKIEQNMTKKTEQNMMKLSTDAEYVRSRRKHSVIRQGLAWLRAERHRKGPAEQVGEGGQLSHAGFCVTVTSYWGQDIL